MESSTKQSLAKLYRKIDSLVSRKPSPKTQKIINISALAILSAGLTISIYKNPNLLNRISIEPLLIIMIFATPLTILLNALELRLMSKLIGTNMPFCPSVETTIIGSAANMLPLPGSAIARVIAMKNHGATFKKSSLTTVYTVLIWAAISFIVSGASLAILGNDLSYVFLSIGILSTFVCILLLLQISEDSHSTAWRLLFTKFLLVTLDVIRIHLSFLTIGENLGYLESSVFVIAAVLGSAVSIVPAGLGIRELVSAGLAPVIGVSPTLAFLSATVNRIAGLAVLTPAALALSLSARTDKHQ